jgi:hypothetical protein
MKETQIVKDYNLKFVMANNWLQCCRNIYNDHNYTKETIYIVSATSWLKAIPLQLYDISHPIVRSQSRLVHTNMRDIMWTEM